MYTGIAFILLNVVDAYFTKEVLGMGAVELNPVGMLWGSIVVKGLVALAIVAGLYLCKKGKLLFPLSLECWGFASGISQCTLWLQRHMLFLSEETLCGTPRSSLGCCCYRDSN